MKVKDINRVGRYVQAVFESDDGNEYSELLNASESTKEHIESVMEKLAQQERVAACKAIELRREFGLLDAC